MQENPWTIALLIDDFTTSARYSGLSLPAVVTRQVRQRSAADEGWWQAWWIQGREFYPIKYNIITIQQYHTKLDKKSDIFLWRFHCQRLRIQNKGTKTVQFLSGRTLAGDLFRCPWWSIRRWSHFARWLHRLPRHPFPHGSFRRTCSHTSQSDERVCEMKRVDCRYPLPYPSNRCRTTPPSTVSRFLRLMVTRKRTRWDTMRKRERRIS